MLTHSAKGMLQTNPPDKPKIANCQKGSEPEEPKIAPIVGMKKVRYVIGNKIMNLVLVATDIMTAISAGILKVMTNSHKSNLESLVRMSLTNMRVELVAAPARLPSSTILITICQFMPPS